MKGTLSSALLQTKLKNQAIVDRPITHNTQRSGEKKRIRINSQQTSYRKEIKPNFSSILSKEKGRELNEKNSVGFISILDSSVQEEISSYDPLKEISKIDEARTHSAMNTTNRRFYHQKSKAISDYSPSYAK